jgi:uncharacterized protein
LGRIVLLLIIAFLVYLVFRGFFRVNTRRPAPPAKSVEGEAMVTCARCGVNLPKSEALLTQGTFVCQDNPRCKAP